MTKISVVVPVYNVETELERCVQSICNQTYKNLEIILVDDGSTDNSGKICDEFAKKDKRIKVIHQTNAGSPAARKAGFKMSIGGVIAFVDSDDYIEAEMYEKLMENMIETNADIVFCDYNSVKDGKSDKRYFDNSSKILTKEEALKYLANDEIKSFMWNKLYKIEILNETDFYVGKIMEDFLCMPDIFIRSEKISYIHGAFYNYVRRNASIMGNKSNMFKYWNACKFRLDWYKDNYPQAIDLCMNRIARVALTCFEDKNLNTEQQFIVKEFLSQNLKAILKNAHLNLHKKAKIIFFIY